MADTVYAIWSVILLSSLRHISLTQNRDGMVKKRIIRTTPVELTFQSSENPCHSLCHLKSEVAKNTIHQWAQSQLPPPPLINSRGKMMSWVGCMYTFHSKIITRSRTAVSTHKHTSTKFILNKISARLPLLTLPNLTIK